MEPCNGNDCGCGCAVCGPLQQQVVGLLQQLSLARCHALACAVGRTCLCAVAACVDGG